jgi:ATP-dependent Clp protease ATP-binding subunit ClpC
MAWLESAFSLDRILSPHWRKNIREVLAVLLGVGTFGVLLNLFNTSQLGAYLLLLGIWIVFWLLEFFHNSFYYASLPVHFEMASVVDAASGGDLVRAFLTSPQGKWILIRLGLTGSKTKAYAETRLKDGVIITIKDLDFSHEEIDVVGMSKLLTKILEKDQHFMKFLVGEKVRKDDIAFAASWFDRKQRQYADSRRWWSREALSRIPGLAKDWTFGQVWYLEKYGREIGYGRRTAFGNLGFGKAQIAKLENALAKNEEANALLVGERGSGVLDLVYGLAELIGTGHSLPELGFKRMFFVDIPTLLAEKKTKLEFEAEYIKLMNEAVHAGNVILVFDNLSSAIQEAASIGVDLVALTDPYLAGAQIQVIAVVDTFNFHDRIEPNQAIMERFEKIIVEDADDGELEVFIEKRVEWTETKERVHFTAQAVRTILETTRRYFGADSGLDKVGDLIAEVVPFVRRGGSAVITRDDILKLVEQKTGVPLGAINQTEKETLLHLEDLLHKEVIGQDEAIVSIANALRRARVGITSPNRPIGSFLFLGPTGVGKTETTKALARIFFGGENDVIRLDMSEFKAGDALKRLIGQFEDGKTGILSSLLRDRQYGVLLLDEFEKASREVHDLFLQILDEGFFSDMHGRKVYARNLIIIATSNAGSDLIWKVMQEKAALLSRKADIVDSIISQGIFRPELLNRFDGVVLFHPLEKEHLKLIAGLMMKKLNKRLLDKGVQVEVNDELINYLVEKGSDRQFGARAMNRAIQEHVEQAVAKKLISEEILPGTVIELNQADF